MINVDDPYADDDEELYGPPGPTGGYGSMPLVGITPDDVGGGSSGYSNDVNIPLYNYTEIPGYSNEYHQDPSSFQRTSLFDTITGIGGSGVSTPYYNVPRVSMQSGNNFLFYPEEMDIGGGKLAGISNPPEGVFKTRYEDLVGSPLEGLYAGAHRGGYLVPEDMDYTPSFGTREGGAEKGLPLPVALMLAAMGGAAALAPAAGGAAAGAGSAAGAGLAEEAAALGIANAGAGAGSMAWAPSAAAGSFSTSMPTAVQLSEIGSLLNEGLTLSEISALGASPAMAGLGALKDLYKTVDFGRKVSNAAEGKGDWGNVLMSAPGIGNLVAPYSQALGIDLPELNPITGEGSSEVLNQGGNNMDWGLAESFGSMEDWNNPNAFGGSFGDLNFPDLGQNSEMNVFGGNPLYQSGGNDFLGSLGNIFNKAGDYYMKNPIGNTARLVGGLASLWSGRKAANQMEQMGNQLANQDQPYRNLLNQSLTNPSAWLEGPEGQAYKDMVMRRLASTGRRSSPTDLTNNMMKGIGEYRKPLYDMVARLGNSALQGAQMKTNALTARNMANAQPLMALANIFDKFRL